MKKIYTIAFAVLAFGTLSAQTNNTGQTNSKTKAKKAASSITVPEYKQTPKQATKKSKISTTDIKAVEKKKNVKTDSK